MTVRSSITPQKGERRTDIRPKLQWAYAMLLAVKNVTQNRGKRTAGIDGAKWTTPNAKMNAALRLSEKRYKAKPLRRVSIPKPGSAKKRPLSIPTMYDRAMQALYALALSPVAESTADARSFGFRT